MSSVSRAMFILCCAAATVRAQAVPAGAAAVLKAEDALLAAMANRDSAALDKLLAPRFSVASAYSTGEVMPRAMWLSGLLDRRSQDAGRIESPTVTLHTPDVATVTARITWIVKDPGPTPEREEYLVTDTWLRRNGRWQIAARHSSLRRPSVRP